MVADRREMPQEAEIQRKTFLDHPLTRALGRTAVAGIALMTLVWIPTKIEVYDPAYAVMDIAGATAFAAAALYALKRARPLQIFRGLRA